MDIGIIYNPIAFWLITLCMLVLSFPVVPAFFRSIKHNKDIRLSWEVVVWCLGVVYFLSYHFPV